MYSPRESTLYSVRIVTAVLYDLSLQKDFTYGHIQGQSRDGQSWDRKENSLNTLGNSERMNWMLKWVSLANVAKTGMQAMFEDTTVNICKDLYARSCI